MKHGIAILGIALALDAQVLAETYVVRPDGSGDFPTIQVALEHVEAGDVIELTDGTYTGQGNRDIDFLGKGVVLRSQSGSPASCIIDCQGTAAAPHRGFIFASGEGPRSVLSGVAIENGFANGEWPDGCGAAVYCFDGSSPTLTDCVFRENTAGAGGGGVFADLSSPAVSNCTFLRNSAVYGGGMECNDSAAELTDCHFLGNTATFGGAMIFCWAPGPSLRNCLFRANSAGAGGAVYW